ncbi:8537_t:CDS:1, partial [Funneliformis caledonium]
VVGFNDATRVTVLSDKMGGRFVSPNLFNNGAGNAVNTPDLFQAWLRDKYREVKIGTAQASMKALMYEKFNTIDTPETYEKRIRPH